MSVSQISVFLESKPGHLRRVLDSFEEAGVSVRGYSASDTGDYGIVRFIVDDPDAALAVLQGQGAAATKTEVLCVRLDDRPGELARVMGVMADCGINVSYSYSLISTYIALSVKDRARAEELLAHEPVDVYKRQADVVMGQTVDARGLAVAQCPNVAAEYVYLTDDEGTVYFEPVSYTHLAVQEDRPDFRFPMHWWRLMRFQIARIVLPWT